MTMAKIIVVSGTPGTGKTLLAKRLAEKLRACYVNLSNVVIEKKLYIEYDADRNTFVVDEERVREYLRRMAQECELIIVDSHYGEISPKELVDKIIVLRLDPVELEKRLKDRGWSRNKIKENVQAEILGVCTVNALEEHGEDKVFEINVTGKSLEELVEEALDIIENKKGKKEYIDWFSIKTFKELERYMV